MLLFYKLVQETQMSTPPEATRCHNLTKLLILLPLRNNSKSTFQCETPCRISLESSRGPLLLKPVTGQELFFAVSYSKPALIKILSRFVLW